jgi:hypothetical protein
MLSFIGFCIRTVVFTAVVLLLGNWVSWDGRSLSQHIQRATTRAAKAVQLPISTSLSSPMRAVSREAQELKEEAKEIKAEVQKKVVVKAKAAKDELVSTVEKMRLRSLIRESETK